MDNQEQLELIKSMADRLERIERRQKAARGWKLVIWLCVIAMLAAVVIYAGPKVVTAVENYRSAISEINKFADAMDGVDLSAVKTGLKSLEGVDFDALKAKAAELSKLTDKLSAVDFDNVTKVLEDFNDSMAPILKMFTEK